MLTSILLLLAGLAAGILITWLILRERLSAKNTGLETAFSKLAANDNSIANLQKECSGLTAQLTAADVRLSEQRKAFEEKLAFKEVLGTEFKNLANEILEDKSKRF